MTEQAGVVRLAERLGGTTVLLTGVTGFVGEALLHRMLTQTPDTSIAVLVRRKGSASGLDRIKTVLPSRSSPTWSRQREETTP